MNHKISTAPFGGVPGDPNVERMKESEPALTTARAQCREQSHQLLEAYDKLTKAMDGSLSHAEAEGQFDNALDGLKCTLSDFGVYLAFSVFHRAEQDYRQRNPTTQIPSDPFGTLIEFDANGYDPEELYYHGNPDLEKFPLSEDRGWKLAVAMTALPPELVVAIEDMPFKMSVRTGHSCYRCETELYDLIGRLVEPLLTCSNEPAEFMPHQEDMEVLARAYLDKAIELHCYSFVNGACDAETEAMRVTARFEVVAKYLGQAKRQEIIDLVDKRGYETSGDEWEAFKSTAEGFWSTPADRGAILRLAASLPDDLSQLGIGSEYCEVLEQARGGRNPEEEDRNEDD
jgi:hypothetical protein